MFMRILLICLVFQFYWLPGKTQQKDSLAMKYAASITQEELKLYIEMLASDEFEGRETGQKGEKMAADYLGKEFQALGLPPVNDGSYFQEFKLKEYKPQGSVVVGNKEFRLLKDFVVYGKGGEKVELDSMLFCGFGMETESFNEYAGMPVKGKNVMVLAGEPRDKNGFSRLTGDTTRSAIDVDFIVKTRRASEKGARRVFYVVKDFTRTIAPFLGYFANPKLSLDDTKKVSPNEQAIYIISDEMASAILEEAGQNLKRTESKINRRVKPESFPFAAEIDINTIVDPGEVTARNVLGYIEGTDLRDEILLITAHFDHLGKHHGDIYHGADDNGSGTAGLLEIAEAFALAKRDGHGPRRSVLVMPVTAEEKGLLGSNYYSKHPVFPLENTIADLNIDMIGRHDEKHEGKPNYIYVIGSDRLSLDLHDLNEWVNQAYVGIDLDYTYNAKDDPNNYYGRSDHINFARKKVPVIFYFSGNHEDYHKPTDTMDKIEFDRLEERIKLVFYTAWHLANGEERPRLNEEK